MHLTAHKPAAPLGEFVENLWLLSDAPGHQRERIVPGGTFELVVNLCENAFRIYDPARAGDGAGGCREPSYPGRMAGRSTSTRRSTRR